MVVKGSVGGGEFLQVRHPPKPQHRPLSSTKWQVAILGPIVEMATDLLVADVSNHFHRGTVTPEPVGNHSPRRSVPLHRFTQEPQSR